MSKRMNPEIKSKWLAALRSGEYEQARGSLHRIMHTADFKDKIDCGFCCLGVLCDIAAREDVCWWLDGEAVTVDPMGKTLFDNEVLPRKVAEWAGLDDLNPVVPFDVDDDEDRERKRLSELNDEYRFDFERIANIIEEHL